MKLPKKYQGITLGGFDLGDEQNESCEVLLGTTYNLVASLDRHDKNTGEIVIERSEMLSNARLFIDSPRLAAAVLADREVLKRIDDAWTRDFPGGPDSPEMVGGFARLSEETIETWKLIRGRIASTKEWEA